MTIDELRERLENLEKDCSDHESTMHACIKAIGQRLERLEAHREPTPAPAIEPPELSDKAADRLWDTTINLPCREATRTMYRAGWDAALAAVAQQQPAPPAPAPAGSLVVRMAYLLARRFSESRPGTDCTPFARDVLRAVAEWLDSVGNNGSASELRWEADR